jgi:protein-disulfide isomerase
MSPKTLFTTAFILLMLVFIGTTLYYTAEKEGEGAQLAAANQSALERMHSPTIGKPDARVTIVEFLDPACETCSAFYPRVKEMMAANPDQIRLVLRYAPFHNGSDRIVAVLEAARRQGKFWQALEALLATQAQWAPHHTPQLGLIWRHLAPLGLDMQQLATDADDPAIASLIAQDIADARTLNVTKTPEFFVNGQPLPSFGLDQLQKLVNQGVTR